MLTDANNTIEYIIRFLLGDSASEEIASTIGYTTDKNRYGEYKIVIQPSGFFDDNTYGTPQSLPTIPLNKLDDTPLLFGDNQEEVVGETLVLHADIIASTYFLISRYEEMVRADVRDQHGRFPGKESLPYKANALHRPVVDEYGRYLRMKLQQQGIDTGSREEGIRRVYLTHDVDAPFYCRSFRNVARETWKGKGLFFALKSKFGALERDLNYTFPWLFSENNRLQKALGAKRCQTVVFFKAGGKALQDNPIYNLNSKDIKRLLELCNSMQIEVGLHSSYQAGIHPKEISGEKAHLEQAISQRITLNRHHFLTCRQPEDMEHLHEAGIEHDFTMGYADVAGFRLGTCRPVRYINPTTKQLSSLLLHPMTVMECTLSDDKYMKLSYEEALTYSQDLLAQVSKHGGEVVLLWHNSAIAGDCGYLKHLYTDLLNDLIAKGCL